jgi:hypothetical protein
MIEWLQDQTSAVALDTRPHPAVISSWHGRPTVELIDRYYRWSDAMTAAALAAEQRLVCIADLRAAGAPSPWVCKRLYEHARDDVAREVVLVTIAVVEDPRLRAIIKTMRRLSGGPREPEIVIVDRMADALEYTLARLRAERIPRPDGLDPSRYGAPLPPPTLT